MRNTTTNSPAILRHEAAVQAARKAEEWAGITAYARPDGSYITIKEEHQNGEWLYTATHHTDAYSGSHPSVTFTRAQRATGLGLKQLAARVLKG